MRVLQVVTKPQRRGAEIFAYDLSRQFEALGIDVRTIYLYHFNGSNRLPLMGSDVCLEGSEDHFLERVLGFHPTLLYGVVRQIRSFKPDIVQVNGSRTVKYGAVAKQLLLVGTRWKLVYRNIGIPSDWHHGGEREFAYRFLIMPKMDGVIGVSQTSLSDARALYQLKGPDEVITNGISPARLQTSVSRNETRKEYGVASGDFVLLFLGSLEREKRPDRFIRVLARVHNDLPSVWGWIVGEGALREELRELAADLKVENRIRFFGNQKDVAKFLSAADMFLLTSDTEGLPATVLEAAYMGLPVAATRVGGLAECVEDGKTGFLVNGDYESGLTETVLCLAGDDEKRKAVSRNAKIKAQNEFTINHVARKYLDFYTRLSDPMEAAVTRSVTSHE
jgi:glycosyltransferase involved in cell wall biosynthesis